MKVFCCTLAVILAGISLTLAVGDEEELVTLRFGDDVGDNFGPYSSTNDFVSGEIQLDGRYMFYGKEQRSLYISENGVISFEAPFPDPFPRPLPLTMPSSGTSTPPPLIAGFWGDINVPKNGGAILHIEMNERVNGRFGNARAKVLNLLRGGFGHTMEDFFPTHIFLSTWESVHENNPGIAKRAVTFQIVLVTDSVRTYVLLLYSDVRWDSSNGHGVLVGFNAGDGVRSYTHPFSNGSILDLDFQTNAGFIGAHIYRVDTNEITEPTDAQRSQALCVVSFDGSEEQERQYPCDCPSEDRPILAFNKINCLQKPLAVRFQNDTPLVVGNSVRAHFSANRPGVQISCHIPKIDRGSKDDCSSGKLVRHDLLPGKYSMRIIARDPATRERAILRGYFYVAKVNPLRELPCGVTVINTSSEKQRNPVTVEFRGTGSSRTFECRLVGGENIPCESPYTMEGLSSGRHRLVVVPGDPECTRKNRHAVSHYFTVQSS